MWKSKPEIKGRGGDTCLGGENLLLQSGWRLIGYMEIDNKKRALSGSVTITDWLSYLWIIKGDVPCKMRVTLTEGRYIEPRDRYISWAYIQANNTIYCLMCNTSRDNRDGRLTFLCVVVAVYIFLFIYFVNICLLGTRPQWLQPSG